jgi:hypothetical protein
MAECAGFKLPSFEFYWNEIPNNTAANHKIILTLYNKRFSTKKHDIIAVLQFMYKI